MNKIVVGIDGLEGSRKALRWAFGEAQLRHVPLCVVHAWRAPRRVPGLVLHGAADAYPGDSGTVAATESRLARDLIERELQAIAAGKADVPIERRAAEGDPAKTLLEAAEGAELLVVGSSRNALERALLGDVARTCVSRASCPVVVVPYGD